MSRNTAALVAAFQAAPEVPADSNERIGVEWVRQAAIRCLPDVPSQVLGDVLMHFVSFFDSVIDSIGEATPMLDWESRTHVTRNIIGVAGMELYTQATTAEPPVDPTKPGGWMFEQYMREMTDPDFEMEPPGCTSVRPGPHPGLLAAPRCIRWAGHTEANYPHDQHEGAAGSSAVYWPVTATEPC